MKENKKAAKSARTKEKLLNAVEKVLATKGFTELKVNSICEASGVDKKLIYFHFGDLNGLFTEFLKTRDFWSSNMPTPTELSKDTAKAIFQHQFDAIYNSDLLTRLLIWELSEGNEVLKKLARDREDFGNDLIQSFVQKNKFKDDTEPLFALIISGIYYLSIHSKINGSTFCGLNLNEAKDRERLHKTINKLIDGLK